MAAGHEFAVDVCKICDGAGLANGSWVAIASTLPHVTVRATDELHRNILLAQFVFNDKYHAEKHGDVDIRVTLVGA